MWYSGKWTKNWSNIIQLRRVRAGCIFYIISKYYTCSLHYFPLSLWIRVHIHYSWGKRYYLWLLDRRKPSVNLMGQSWAQRPGGLWRRRKAAWWTKPPTLRRSCSCFVRRTGRTCCCLGPSSSFWPLSTPTGPCEPEISPVSTGFPSAPWSWPSRPFKPQEDQGTRAISPWPRHRSRASGRPSPSRLPFLLWGLSLQKDFALA